MKPTNEGATRGPIKLILDMIVRAVPTGIVAFSPTILYNVGTIQEIPNPMSMKPVELTTTFAVMPSTCPIRMAEVKNPAKIQQPATINTVFFDQMR